MAISALMLSGCAVFQPGAGPANAVIVDITLLQLNDVYEITPVEGGHAGGLARVATLRKQLLAENPNTFTLLAGDLLSPSAIGTAKVDGETLSGRQMVSVLNAVGLDIATFGNHEFDLDKDTLRKRLGESRFRWTSANVATPAGAAFDGVSPHELLKACNPQGACARIAVVGVTLDHNKKHWVNYADAIPAMQSEIRALNGQADVILALTHLELKHDIELAQTIPEIDLVLGGHEHENIQAARGADFTPVLKADANARTVYVHRLRYDTAARKLAVESRLVPVNDGIADDPEVAQQVQSWMDKGFAGFRADGFEPNEVVATVPEPLDGREASVRNRPTRLTQLLADAQLAEVPGSELAMYNSGSIRIDDQLPPGPVTQYDVIRVMPFGGKVQGVSMRGDLLKQALDQGQASAGTGAYLQTANVSGSSSGWLVQGKPIDPKRWYTVAINAFLARGEEQGFSFLKPGEQMKLLGDYRDPRKVLIAHLRKTYPAAAP
ncbi:MAG: bifunctional metallophosphatase/5'-nucleotidase [Panacagrimonas sp.]